MNLWISMWTGAAQPESANAGLPPNPREVVQSVMQTALRGSLPGVPFSDGENIEQVMKAWGCPFAQGDGGAGVYVTYRDKDVAFGLNQGDQIFDVRSYAPALQALTYERRLQPPSARPALWRISTRHRWRSCMRRGCGARWARFGSSTKRRPERRCWATALG